MSAAFHKKMQAIWHAKTNPTGESPAPTADRYVPQATGKRAGHWGVFDRKRDRFLEDQEVVAVKLDDLLNETLAN